MTVQVSGPDGSTFEFPAGTPHDVVTSALQKHYGAASKAPAGAVRQVQPPPATSNDRSFGGDQDLQAEYKTGKEFQSPFQRRLLDSATLGASDEVLAGLATPVNALIDPIAARLKGKIPANRSWGEIYDRNLQLQRAYRNDAASATSGPVGVAADVLGGLMMVPAKAVASVKAAAPLAAETWKEGLKRLAQEKIAMAPALAKAGAAWGGGQAFFGADGSSNSDASLLDHFATRAGAVPAGAVEGSIGALAVGNALHSALGVHGISRARKVDRIERQKLAALDWQAEGMSAPGYAITESPTAQATARGVADSILGGSIRTDAKARTQALVERAQTKIREASGGIPSNDMGEIAQQALRRNLHEYTIPNSAIKDMANRDLERYSGEVTKEGFRPPRPHVEPIPPREIPEMSAQEWAQSGLPPRVEPVQPRIVYPNRDAIQLSPELQKARSDHDLAVAEFNSRYQMGSKKLSGKLDHDPPVRRQELEIGVIDNKINEINAKHRSEVNSPDFNYYNPKNRDAERRAAQLVERRNKLREELEPMYAEHQALKNNATDLKNKSDQYTLDEFRQSARDVHAKAVAEADMQTHVNNATAETQARRFQAQLDADAHTQSARDAANNAYQMELQTNPGGFKLGRTRESYPTEAAAAYERVLRETPPVQPALLGTKNGTTPTATEALLHDFAAQARRQNQAAGYKSGTLFGVDGSVIHPQVGAYLEKNLGHDIYGQLNAYATRRSSGQLNPGIEGVRDLRTAIRRAAQDSERSIVPGESRSTDAAMLRRLEGAVSEDLHAFQRRAGPQGERSSQMMSAVDREYGATLIDSLRKPLTKLYGDKVTPIQAMDRLSKAAEAGDTRTLSAYMRVMSEKDDPLRAAASIIAHNTNGAATLKDYMKGYGALPNESKTVLFRGEQGRALRVSLDRLETLMGKMEPFQKAITSGGGIDLTNKTNLASAAAALTHPYLAIVGAGGTALAARFMSSPRYTAWLTNVPRAAPRGLSSPAGMRELARLAAVANTDTDHARGKAVLSAIGDMLRPTSAHAQATKDTPAPMFTSLERPPTTDEVKSAILGGADHFDFDLDQGDTKDSVDAIHKAGRKVTAYHVGGGGGREWGSAKTGEQVRKYNTPEELTALTEDTKRLVAKGADYVHFDNTHRMSGKRLEAVADAITAGGAGFVAKNNAEKWNIVMKRRPDLKPAYAVIEAAMTDQDETTEAYKLHQKGVPVYIIGFHKQKDGVVITDAYAKQYQENNPWARLIMMEDENQYEGRTSKYLGAMK